MGTDRRLRIAALVDPMSASVYDYDTEKEYADMKSFFELLFDVEVDLDSDILPDQLSGRSFDMYVIDYGGMGYGLAETAFSVLREFARASSDYPGKPFVVYSTFTANMYRDLVTEELGEQPANVFVAAGTRFDNEVDRLQQWLGINDPAGDPTAHRLVTPGRKRKDGD